MKKLSYLLLLSAVTVSCSGHGGFHGKKFHERHAAKYFDMMDANGDGLVSKQEHKKFCSQKFTKIDSNKDHKISKKEFSEYKKSHKKHYSKKDK